MTCKLALLTDVTLLEKKNGNENDYPDFRFDMIDVTCGIENVKVCGVSKELIELTIAFCVKHYN